MSAPRQPLGGDLIFVEGKDEYNLVQALLRGFADPKPHIVDCEGKERMPKIVASTMKSATVVASRFKRVGIIRDADLNVSDSLRAAQSLCATSGLPIPERPAEVLRTESAVVGIWLSPRPGETGMLEDLFLECLDGDPLLIASAGHLAALEAQLDNHPRFRLSPHRQKSLSHLCLVGTSSPLKSIGVAATADFWDVNHAAMGQLRQFILEIFGDK